MFPEKHIALSLPHCSLLFVQFEWLNLKNLTTLEKSGYFMMGPADRETKCISIQINLVGHKFDIIRNFFEGLNISTFKLFFLLH